MSEQEFQNMIISNMKSFGEKIDNMVTAIGDIKTCIATLDLRVTHLESAKPENDINKRFKISTTGQFIMLAIACGSLTVAIIALLSR